MKRSISLGLVAVAAIALGAGASQARAALIYEGFSYGLANNAYMRGVAVTGTGLTGNWAVNYYTADAGAGATTIAQYRTTGLTFGSLAVTGGSLYLESGLRTNMVASTGTSLTGFTGTIYGSFLFSSASLNSNTNTNGVGLATMNNPDVRANFNLITGVTGYGGANTTYLAAGSSMNGNAAWINGNETVANNTVYMAIWRLTNVQTTSASHTLTQWILTPEQFANFKADNWASIDSAVQGAGSANFTSKLTSTATSTINLSNNYLDLRAANDSPNSAYTNVTFDEIRYGTSFNDVTPLGQAYIQGHYTLSASGGPSITNVLKGATVSITATATYGTVGTDPLNVALLGGTVAGNGTIYAAPVPPQSNTLSAPQAAVLGSYGDNVITATVGSVNGVNGSGAGILDGAAGTTTVSGVGQATLGGAALTATVADGGDYTGLASQVTGDLLTEAVILGGSNLSGDSTVASMAWRVRSEGELGLLASDVVDLDGTPGTYVLQMSYDENAASISGNEDALAANQQIFLAYFNGSAWVNPGTNFQGVNSTPTSGLGDWGVNTTDNTVWVVLDHNSQFAVVPEPATMAFLAIGGIGLIGGAIRRRRSA